MPTAERIIARTQHVEGCCMDDAWDPRPLREFFQEIMRRNGWNQSELARATHTAPSVVGRWLNGENRPTTEKLRQVASGLHVDYGTLLVRAGYLEETRNARSPRHADLCAKLDQLTLTDEEYRLLDYVVSAMVFDIENPLLRKPTG